MSAAELKAYIDKVLGNSIRCLLPSYWWKRVIGLVIDDVDSVRSAVSNKASKSDLTSLEKRIDGQLAEKQTVKISPTSSLLVYGYPDVTYVIRPTTAGTLKISALFASVEDPDVVRFTFMFTNVNGLSLPSDVIWVNGEKPDVIDAALHYELSVVATRIGSSFVYKAVLASFS